MLALASCSQDEVIKTNPGKAIGFSTPAVTKGTAITGSNSIGEFFATALLQKGTDENPVYDAYFENAEYFNAVDFFISNPSYYWPDEDTELTFAAYAPDMGFRSEQTDDETDVVLKGITQDADISNHKDFMTAVTTGSEENDGDTGIEINFKHRTSQITVQARSTNSDYVYKIKGYRISNVLSKGDFYILDESWDMSDEKTSYTLVLEDGVTIDEIYDGTPFDYNNAFILPQESITNWDPANPSAGGSYLGILINITTKDGSQVYPGGEDGAYDWVAVPFRSLTEFKEGWKYNLSLDFSNGAGYVAPDLEDPVNNTPGTKIGNELRLTRTVTEWADQETAFNQDIQEISGEWKLFRFAQKEYADDGVLQTDYAHDFNIDNADDTETDENGQTEKDRWEETLKELTGMFYHMRISSTGNYIIPIDDEGNESSNRAEFEYKDKKLYIQGLSVEDNWTVPEIIDIKDNPDKSGQKIIQLEIDRPGDHVQHLWFHFIPEGTAANLSDNQQ